MFVQPSSTSTDDCSVRCAANGAVVRRVPENLRQRRQVVGFVRGRHCLLDLSPNDAVDGSPSGIGVPIEL